MLEIYIKPAKKASIVRKTEILLKDIAEVVSLEAGVGDVKIADVVPVKKTNLLISAVDIIRALKREYPNAIVINLGECDTLVQYASETNRDNRLIGWLKVICVALILFAGSATAIMSFYTDAQMNTVFENMHYLITGRKTDRPLLIEIPFCFGLALGIMVFFNHVAGKKLGGDPTPIEIEMSSYQSDITEAVLEELVSERMEGRPEND